MKTFMMMGLLVTLAAMPASSTAEIYKCMKDGKPNFTDTPCATPALPAAATQTENSTAPTRELPREARTSTRPAKAGNEAVSLVTRLASCDATVVAAAANQILQASRTTPNPGMLFHAAFEQRLAGNMEDAAFLYFAARLQAARMPPPTAEYQIQMEMMDTMRSLAEPFIQPLLDTEPELARRAAERAIAWDRAGSQASSPKVEEAADEISRIAKRAGAEPSRLSAARLAAAKVDATVINQRKARCESGKLDAPNVEGARKDVKRQAEAFVVSHPQVISRAGGPVRSASVAMFKLGKNGLPTLMSLSVRPESGDSFYAKVKAITSVLPDRRLGPVEFRFLCIGEFRKSGHKNAPEDPCVHETGGNES